MPPSDSRKEFIDRNEWTPENPERENPPTRTSSAASPSPPMVAALYVEKDGAYSGLPAREIARSEEESGAR